MNAEAIMPLEQTLSLASRQAPQRPLSGKRGLLLWTAMLAIIWLVLLPWLAEQSALKSEMQFLQERGVDPSAMYYTELEAMKPVLKKLHARERGQQ